MVEGGQGEEDSQQSQQTIQSSQQREPRALARLRDFNHPGLQEHSPITPRRRREEIYV